MPPKHPWLQKCLARLEELPQIKATAIVEPGFTGDILADGILTIYTPHNQIEYIVEIKSNIDFETLDTIIEYLKHLQEKTNNNQNILLITDKLYNEIVEELIERNIEFIDTTGNIYINNYSVYILIKSSSINNKQYVSSCQININALKVAYLILNEPLLMSLPQELLEEKISNILGVNINTAKESLEILSNMNYLHRRSSRQYIISDYNKLLERWELGYLENLRSQILIGTFTTLHNLTLFDILPQIFSISTSYKILIGGEFGATYLTNYLEPSSIVLYIPNNINYRSITSRLRLKQYSKGKITIMEYLIDNDSFKKDDICASPLLIHAELLLNPDERLKETANRIYQEYILPLKQEADMLL
ncbi:MAG TPA: type IV toxin-antitoxin system AbiEi family antitoxin [Nostocaceae cyanobacterium]|nr:type IV toxin-antitoxin system AbiEi family antitoxin [Nostocaceae cyanobacterium]